MQGRPGELLPRLRVAWQLKCFQACPVHREFLTWKGADGRLLSPSWTDLIRDIDRGHPFPPEARGEPADVFAAEAYLLGRLGSAKSVKMPLLDSCATQTVPSFLLNVAKAYHGKEHVPGNPRDASLFVNQAFPSLADTSTFRRLLELCEQRRRSKGSPENPRQYDVYPEWNKAFGSRPYGGRLLAFRQIAAEYISERYPTGEEKISYDCPVPKLLYSLDDLYRRTGVHSQKAQKIISHVGIEYADPGRLHLREAAVERFVSVMDSMVDVDDLVKMWGVTKDTARSLIGARVVVPWAGGSSSDLHKYLFKREDAERILRNAIGECQKVYSSAPAGRLTLRQASARPGISHSQLVHDLVEGKIKAVGILAGKTGLSAILLDVHDVRPMTTDRFGSRLTITQVIEVLGVVHPVAKALARGGYLGDERYCGKARLFELKDVMHFQERYLSAHQTAFLLGKHARTVREMLAENGILPSISSGEALTNFYDRERVMRLAEESEVGRKIVRG